jgi:parallel beta-helix repeat protein
MQLHWKVKRGERKMKNKLLVVSMLGLLLTNIMPFLALAITSDIKWARVPPTIDGTLASGEWDLFLWFNDGDEPPMEGYIANNDQYLYLAFKVTDSTQSGSRDIFYVYIDIPSAGSFNEPKDAFGFGWIYATTWTTAYTRFETTTNEYPFNVTRKSGTMPAGVEIVANMQPDARYYEMKIPLSVIEALPGDIIGLKIFARNTGGGGPSTDTINWYPNFPEGITPVYPEARVAVEGNYAHMKLAEHAPYILWVDDDWASLPPGTEVEPGKFIGYNAFAKIQDAINVANPSNTIYVHDGVYYENLVVNKALTIQAASYPIIDGDAIGDCISISANNVVISGFEIRNGYNGISGETSGSTFSNNIIHDNLNILGYAGVGILLWGDNDNNIITTNTIYNNDRQGIFIGYSDTTKLSTGNIISHNTVYNNGLYRYANGPDASAYGIQIWCADNNIIEYNEIYGHDDWFPYPDYPTFDFAQGIYLCASFNNIVKGNSLHDNNYGVGVWAAGRTPVSSNQINYNNIAGNTGFGVRTFDTIATDARFNWWGDAGGPTHSSNSGGAGDKISDNVDYSPWLGDGFEVIPRTYHVNPTGAPSAIQEAINEASSGDTIIVHEGTYYENLVVPKALVIQGVNKETTILQAQSAGVIAIEIKSSGVTISEFTISGYAATETSSGSTYWGVYAYGTSSSHYSNIVVTENIFTFLGQSGIQLGYVDGGLVADNVFKRETRLVWYDPPGPTPGSYIYVTRGGSGPALWYCTNVIIDPNIIQTDGVGIFLYSSSNILIESNIISAPDTANPSDVGIHIQSCTNIDIIGNTVQNFTAGPKSGYTWGTTGAGINVYVSKAINLRNNNLYNNTVGVLVQRLNLTTEPREVNIHYNNFEGNTEFGVLNCYTWIGKDKIYTPTNASFVVDARYNWWGHETGPYHGTSWPYVGESYGPNYGLGDHVSDYVLYIPWLPEVHDIAILDVSVSPTTIVAGETVTINVTVKNEGNDFESFIVTVYYDDTPIASQAVTNMFPNQETVLTFYWDTTDMPRGTYTVKAEASTVPGEINTEDNLYINGQVEILWHDVAVVEVVPSRDWVYQGHSVNITVTVINKGDFTETVTITVYYNITANKIIGIQLITLLSEENQTITFTWDTDDVPYCHNYTITAVATIDFDNNLTDNTFTNGKVKVRIMGDIDNNGMVNMLDLWIVGTSFGFTEETPEWNGDIDLNQDGYINMMDLYITAINFGRICP